MICGLGLSLLARLLGRREPHPYVVTRKQFLADVAARHPEANITYYRSRHRD